MVATSLTRSSVLGPPPHRGATGVCAGANTYLPPCKPAVSPSAELRFHPVSASTSICPCNSSFRNSHGVSSRIAEVFTSALRRHRLSAAWEVVPWNEKLSLGRWDGQAAVECLCWGSFKWSRRRKARHFGTYRSFLESDFEMRCIGNLKDGRSPSALGTKQRSPYLKDSRLDRLRCNSAGSDDENDTGKSTATATEEQDEPQSTPPQSSSSDLPENSPLPGSKNLQLDAFRLMELLGPEKVDAADVALLKEKVFGYTTFWVTGQEPFGAVGEGVLLLGNLRGKREEVFAKLQRQLREVTGTKYNLFMVEEPNSEGPDPRGGPRVSFVLLRKEISEPQSTTLWQYVIAFVLFVLTAGSCLQLGLASQLAKLPPDVVRYFTNPEVVEPPDLQLLVPYVESALPLAYGVLGVQLFHEVGHLLTASPKKVKLGIPFFIPNITLGSFGAITQFKSIIPDRTTKFDVSLAGPLAGGLLSFAMLGVGLLLSTTPEAVNDLIQVPSMIFQGSLLLGLLSRAALGYDAMHTANVAIHPLVIAGWCGLTTTAFNLLPVGCLDGGRAMQAAFGKTVLNIFSLVTYLFLGLGVLGGPLSLPWGLYILICQRSPEKPCLNDVSDVGSFRQGAFIFSVMLVVLTLLPLWNNLAEELGIGLGSPLL